MLAVSRLAMTARTEHRPNDRAIHLASSTRRRVGHRPAPTAASEVVIASIAVDAIIGSGNCGVDARNTMRLAGGGSDQPLGGGARLFGDLGAREHAGDLFSPFLGGELGDPGRHALAF